MSLFSLCKPTIIVSVFSFYLDSITVRLSLSKYVNYVLKINCLVAGKTDEACRRSDRLPRNMKPNVLCNSSMSTVR